MRTRSHLVLVVAALLLALTYLLMPLATPDTARHERTSDALRALILNDAALQRDVLQARAGLLRNYDPLVESVENLRRAVDTLRADARVVGGKTGAEIGRRVERVSAAMADQEALVEAFKSRNALLQNSLSFFAHTIQQFDTVDSRQPNVVTTEVGRLANAMLRFTREPRGDVASDATASLDRLSHWPSDDENSSIHALVSHGRLIVASLPAVDDTVTRLLAGPTAEGLAALEAAYAQAHAHAVAHASTFGILLYIAALALVAYVGYLFLRLRANARTLRTRLDFEQLIAAISARFVNRPLDSIDDGINDGLARLATHAGVDRAHIAVCNGNETGVRDRYLWSRRGMAAPAGQLDDVIDVALHWPFPQYERQGCVHVPDVRALPDSAEKSHLLERGIRSWLCIPMWWAGKRVGFLTLDAVSAHKHWPDDDIALSRTAGEILANAIERQRSESEREMLQTRLHQAQRLESIGTLAGGIAHEFNNILGAIFGYAELALATIGSGSRAERHLNGIMTAGERAQAVINQILTFSRRSERRPRLVTAESVVAEAVELLRASLPSTVAIETKLETGDAAVMADPTELQQVVMNLCTNGAHAMKNHGTLHVCLETVEVEHGLALSHGSLPAGRYVRLAVTDTGSGIDAATLERILEPFFTTKAVGKGTGLGLSTVHGIVTQHGGALNVKSRLGEGSSFQAYFPRAGEIAVAQRKPATPGVPHGHGETVLIVDDEATLVPLAEEMVAALGYEAVGFDQSTTALQAFRAAPERFDLVLTDDIMPEMTGTELARTLHEIRPSLPIILMTGGGRPIGAQRLQAAGIREVVKKPLLSGTIAELLARHLSPRAGQPDENGVDNQADRPVPAGARPPSSFQL
jgi:signal transduction histidine kinase/ActR/RegA family two-component response regulator